MARGATNVVGLDIGADAIKAVQLRKTSEGLRVVGRPGYVPTPSGSVSGGVVVDEDAVAGTVKQMAADCGFTTKDVVASVGGTTSVTVRVVTMPQMSGAELSDAMDYELDRQVPFPIDQVIYDYQIIESADGGEGDEMSVLLAAAQEDTVGAHIAAIMGAGLHPIHIDIEPLAVSRALVNVSTNGYTHQTVAIAHIGSSQTEISILRSGVLEFVRAIPTAGETFTTAIRRELGSDQQQAEQAKRQFADTRDLASLPGEQPEQIEEAKQAMQGIISEALFELATELGRTVDFYRRQHGGQEISRLLLSGGSAVIPGLADFLAAETGVDAEVARPYQYLLWDADELSEAYLQDVGPATCVALGLAMRDMLSE